ncbi:hypothetical protein GOBAR_AA28480 [Gossypium barbadense]|uniref:Uncharacterized protein n=1 Tax=Gossypium barbadense TaxID=3634 RepID=A0A2P5WMB1_GOSBA|nr:hypothetical protein GOBAR_AA28480 [Gossypium barbadense]
MGLIGNVYEVLKQRETWTLANHSWKLPDVQSWFHPDNSSLAPNFNQSSYGENGFSNPNSSGIYYENSMVSSEEDHISFTTFVEAPHSMSSSLDMQTNNRQWSFQDVDDLQSMAFGYA